MRPTHLWTAIAVTAGLVLTVLIGGSLLPIPYFSIAPGEARPVAPSIHIEAPTFEAGEILFLTISLNHVTLLEGAAGWADPDVDVVPEELILGSGTEEQNREANQRAMTDSKDVAMVVALSRLGYELDPTGTGAVVSAVTPGSPAESVLGPNDTLVAVDGQPVFLPGDLGTLIGDRAPGDVVALTIEGVDGAMREERVALGRCGDIPDCRDARPEEPDSAFLGVATDARDFDPGLPFVIGIDSGAVGGPSAGLAFTLALLDLLTPGVLTGPHRVAVTGTILPDGTVGEVGGVVQKAAAAADAGATVLLVPRGEEEEALAHSHGMEVIAVDDLDDALLALEGIGGDHLPEEARPAGTTT